MYADQKFRQTRRLPIRLEQFGLEGWTFYEFTCSEAAAKYFLKHQSTKLDCWKVYQVHHGKLMIWSGK